MNTEIKKTPIKLKNFCDNTDYLKAWSSSTSLIMSNKEISFINKYLNVNIENSVLDVGVETGRILKSYVDNSNVKNIYGIDIFLKKINICKKRFNNQNKIIDLKQVNVSN